MSSIFPEVHDRLSGVFPEAISRNPGHSRDAAGTATIHMVRHTSTDIDDKGSTHGWIDETLNDKGKRDASAVASMLEKILPKSGLTNLYTSDLMRAKQTAHMVGAHAGADIIPQFGLRPIDMGNLSGKTHDENAEQMAKLYEKWKTDKSAKIPGGESFADFENRNLGTIQSILQGSRPGDSIAIVGHSITAKLLQKYAQIGGPRPLNSEEVAEISKNEASPDYAKYSYTPSTGVLYAGG